MAVLESSMENKELHKQSPKNNKNALLLSQDLSYAKNLAANDEKVRRRSLKYLKKYLEQRSKANPLTEGSLKVLWKGLFYSMWMSDKPLVQEECAENISDLIHCLQFEDAMHFFKIGMITLQNEWIGIDQLRLDKFLMFVRRLLRQAFFVLKNSGFKKQPNEVFANILEETVLSTKKSISLGLVMHFTEIYLEELAKVADGKLQSSRTIDFLKPYITKLAFDQESRITQWINQFIFTHLMKQHKLGLEYENKYKIWKAHEFVGSINQIQKVIIADDEAEEQESDNKNKTTSQYKPLDPRAGKVDVELPQIMFNAKDISEALLVPKTDPRSSKSTRNHLTIWSLKFFKLHNGIYPMGIRKLESKKNEVYNDTNVNKAAKRLIKFEQKLLARDCKGIKRKRDNSEAQEKGFNAPNLKKKAKKTLAATNSNQDRDKVEKKKDKTLKKQSNYLLIDQEDNKPKKFSKKTEALKLKTNKNKAVLKNKLQKTNPITSDSLSEMGSSIDDNFCFERNSGIWFVTPEISENNETAKQKPAKEKKIVNKNTNNGDYEIFTPPKKFANKMKKTKSNRDTEDVLSLLRGKSLTSLTRLSFNQTTPKNVQPKPGSPKKVVINTRLNKSQDMDDHILQVISSPVVPWDSSKKPGKPLLKTPIRASPINPFYKLRKF